MINPNSTKFLFILGIGLLVVSGIFQNNSLIMGFSFLVGLLFILISIIKLFVNKFFKSVNTGLPQKFWPIMGIFLLLFFTICYFADKSSSTRNKEISKAETATPTLSREVVQQEVKEKLDGIAQPQEVTPTIVPTVVNKPTIKPTAKPTQIPVVIEKPKSERDEVIKIIKANAQSKWGSDYEMVVYTQNNQISAYDWVVKQTAYPDIMTRAKSKWGYDFEMVKYTYQNQVSAYEWIMKQTEYPDIMSSAKSKWGGDYEMVKYTYENQVEAYKNL